MKWDVAVASSRVQMAMRREGHKSWFVYKDGLGKMYNNVDRSTKDLSLLDRDRWTDWIPLNSHDAITLLGRLV